MKKVLVFILAFLSSAAMFGQTLHYQADYSGCGNTYTKITGVFAIDGEQIYNGVGMQGLGGQNIEIAAFDQDDVCRFTRLPQWRAKDNAYVYQMSIRGKAEPQSVYHFKVYDHNTDTELDLVDDFGEVIVYVGGAVYGSLTNFYVMNFTTTTTTPTEITWNVGTDWPAGEVPSTGADVTIPGNCVVTIPDGVTAVAGTVTVPDNSTIIIEEGGQLYHTNELVVNMQLDVTGYGSGAKDDNPDNDGYRLFACPVHGTGTNYIPVEGTNLNTGNFDLYKFDESQDLEWINFEADEFENLVLGEGYLYANEQTLDNVVLTGSTLPTNDTYDVNLSYTPGAGYPGWNLVGNPYTCNAYVMVGGAYSPYYVLNGDGDEIEAEAVLADEPIATMKGLFVQATEDGQLCTFTTDAPSKGGSLNIFVNKDRGMVDNAIISFGNSRNLEKFQLNPKHAKVYIPQDNKDYAVVNAENEGELPVCFRTAENGTYTIGFNSEDTDFSYLHLIDNVTGNDVDLLENPSYTFDAQFTDIAARFKLVFATSDCNTGDNFAFISNGNLMILGLEGEATLQMIDVTGRVLSSETFSGSYNRTVNAPAGVYMIQLIQGNDARTQKIVVK